jgi:hypothetical protein
MMTTSMEPIDQFRMTRAAARARQPPRRPAKRLRLLRSAKAVLCVGATVALCALAFVARADDVDITANFTGTGFNLDPLTGTTAKVFPGVSVTNVVTPIPGGVGSTFPGIFASTHAWTLTNQGTVGASFGNGVFFKAGGTVVNSGAISGINGVQIQGAAGTVNNLLGGTIQGTAGAITFTGVAGTVTNAGSITSSGQAIGLDTGGTVTNLADGLIQGHDQANRHHQRHHPKQ